MTEQFSEQTRLAEARLPVLNEKTEEARRERQRAEVAEARAATAERLVALIDKHAGDMSTARRKAKFVVQALEQATARAEALAKWEPFAQWCVLAYDIWAHEHGRNQRYPSKGEWEHLGEMIEAYNARQTLEDEAAAPPPTAAPGTGRALTHAELRHAHTRDGADRHVPLTFDPDDHPVV